MSPNHVIVFFGYSYRFLRWLSVLEMWFFQLSVGVKASLVESQQMSSVPFILLSCCFHVPFIPISCCIHFRSCSFHFALCSFHFALFSSHVPFIFLSCSFHVPFIFLSCPFIFRRHVSNIQVFERWYVQAGQVGIRPTVHVFIICRYRFCYRVAIVLEACAGCHLQGSWTCTCISISSLSFSGLLMHW